MSPPSSEARTRPASSYRLAAGLLVAFLLASFAPALLSGKVLFAHDNAVEAGAILESDASRPFIDQVRLYVPELHEHVTAKGNAWLRTWNPHNELGRPLFPTGVGNTHLFGQLVIRCARDGFEAYTWLSLLAVVCTAVAAFGFLRELKLEPIACLAGALSLSVGPLNLAWQALPMVQWGYCGAFATLWAAERWIRDGSLWNWLAIVFSVHTILLLGFPEHFVLLGWLCVGWMLWRTFEARRPARQRLLTIAGLAAAALCAAVTVLPAYADLFYDWQRSVRAAFPAQRKIVSTPSSVESLLSLFDTFWIPRSQALHVPLSVSFSAGLAALAAMAFVAKRGHALYWLACGGLCVVASIDQRLMDALGWIGLVFSDWSPVQAAPLAMVVLIALGTHAALTASSRASAALACLAPLALAFAALQWNRLTPHSLSVWPAVIVTGIVAFAALTRSRAAIVVALVWSVAARSAPLLVWQPRDRIQIDSALAEVLQEGTSDGSRYAWHGPPPNARFLPPNQAMLLDVGSVHTYDHLVSRPFDRFALALRTPAPHRANYNRIFRYVRPEVELQESWLLQGGISTLLSTRMLESELLRLTAEHQGVHVYDVALPTLLEARLEETAFETLRSGELRLGEGQLQLAASAPNQPLRTLDSTPDHRRFELDPVAAPSVLFVNQLHHPHWHACDETGAELETVRINGLHQGVRVPAGCRSIELRFLPWSLWMVVPMLLFAALALCYGWVRASEALYQRRISTQSSGPPR